MFLSALVCAVSLALRTILFAKTNKVEAPHINEQHSRGFLQDLHRKYFIVMAAGHFPHLEHLRQTVRFVYHSQRSASDAYFPITTLAENFQQLKVMRRDALALWIDSLLCNLHGLHFTRSAHRSLGCNRRRRLTYLACVGSTPVSLSTKRLSSSASMIVVSALAQAACCDSPDEYRCSLISSGNNGSSS